MSMLREACAALEGLYTKTGHDWELNIQQSLTEPTCATAIVRPEWDDEEPSGLPHFRADESGIEQAALAALRLAREWLDAR